MRITTPLMSYITLTLPRSILPVCATSARSLERTRVLRAFAKQTFPKDVHPRFHTSEHFQSFRGTMSTRMQVAVMSVMHSSANVLFIHIFCFKPFAQQIRTRVR